MTLTTTILGFTVTTAAALVVTSEGPVNIELDTQTESCAATVVTAYLSEPSPRAEAFLWLCQNPGSDAEDLAGRLGISLFESSNIIESLLNEGLLDFA